MNGGFQVGALHETPALAEIECLFKGLGKTGSIAGGDLKTVLNHENFGRKGVQVSGPVRAKDLAVEEDP